MAQEREEPSDEQRRAYLKALALENTPEAIEASKAQRQKEFEQRNEALKQKENKKEIEHLYRTLESHALYPGAYDGRDLRVEPSPNQWRAGFIILRKREEDRTSSLRVWIALGAISLLGFLVLHFLRMIF
jgi:hypothetical protein